MSYRLYMEGEVLRLDFIGRTTRDEFEELLKTLGELERGRAVVPHRITDLSLSDGVSLRYPELTQVAAQRKTAEFPNAFKSAIVAPQPVHVGIARMWTILNEHPQISIQIFPDLAAAQAWIAEP